MRTAFANAVRNPQANPVGYNTIEINKEYSLFSVNFQNADGSDLSIQDVFPGMAGMTCKKAAGESDQIQVMDADGNYSSSYYLSNGEYGKGKYNAAASNKWVLVTKANSPVAAEDPMPVGTTFFYLSRGAKAGYTHYAQIAGGVARSESETYDITKPYTLIGCPYPVDVDINGGIEVTGATCKKAAGESDQIQIMDEDGNYSTSYYLSNGEYGKGKYNPAASNKWVLVTKANSPEATTDKFPCGKGAFYLSRGCDGTVKFLNPIKK